MADQDQYISEVAWKEFEGQEVFPTVGEFIAAMPPATKGLHVLPSEIGKQIPGYRPVTANDADLFGPLTEMYTHPGQDNPNIEDTSIYKVEDANELLKDQSHRDWREIEQQPMDGEPYTNKDKPKPPRAYEDDYAINNYYGRRDPADRRAPESSEDGIEYPVVFTLHVGSHAVGTRTAAVWNEIVAGLSDKVVQASKDCTVRLTKSMPRYLRWDFEVKCAGSDDVHTVHVKALPRDKRHKNVRSMDLRVGCDCGFWKWQGPDYHAATEGYLDRRKRSDGSPPVIRDPKGVNRVCKHVYAAASLFLNYSKYRQSSVRVASYSPEELRSYTVVSSVSDSMRIRALCDAVGSLSSTQVSGALRDYADRIHTHKDS